MYLSDAVFKKAERILGKGMYTVLINPIKQDYSKLILKEDTEVIHNYLVVNTETKAIEFATDQLPAAYEVLQKLDEELSKAYPKKEVLKLIKETIN